MNRLQNYFFASILILSPVVFYAFPALGADIYVTKTEDTNDGLCDADCSLREAIIKANGLASVGSIDIHVPAGGYYLTVEGINENEAATGDLDITNSMTIVGAGMDETIVSALGEIFGVIHDRVFHVHVPNGIVNFQDLGIYGGYVDETDNIRSGGGIAITAADTVNILRCHLFRNYAPGNGGALWTGSGPELHLSMLTLTESLVDENEVSGSGGGIYLNGFPGLLIDRSTITDNRAMGFNGGGGLFVADGAVKIINSTFYKNRAEAASEMLFTEGGVGSISHSTVVSRSFGTTWGNIEYDLSAIPLEFINSIVWGQCYPNYPENFSTLGGNIGEPSNTCGFDTTAGDIVLDSDPILLPLGDYGGPTPTAPPGLLSRAVDYGINNPSNPDVDQRGVERPQAVKGIVPAYDIGAVERESFKNMFKATLIKS
jgi:CSLREA domain-containing protein